MGIGIWSGFSFFYSMVSVSDRDSGVVPRESEE
jgi:hypothetical protein